MEDFLAGALATSIAPTFPWATKAASAQPGPKTQQAPKPQAKFALKPVVRQAQVKDEPVEVEDTEQGNAGVAGNPQKVEVYQNRVLMSKGLGARRLGKDVGEKGQKEPPRQDEYHWNRAPPKWQPRGVGGVGGKMGYKGGQHQRPEGGPRKRYPDKIGKRGRTSQGWE